MIGLGRKPYTCAWTPNRLDDDNGDGDSDGDHDDGDVGGDGSDNGVMIMMAKTQKYHLIGKSVLIQITRRTHHPWSPPNTYKDTDATKNNKH